MNNILYFNYKKGSTECSIKFYNIDNILYTLISPDHINFLYTGKNIKYLHLLDNDKIAIAKTFIYTVNSKNFCEQLYKILNNEVYRKTDEYRGKKYIRTTNNKSYYLNNYTNNYIINTIIIWLL
jgi:hypothetical protein